MNEKINVAVKCAQLNWPLGLGIVGYVNDYKLQVVKVKGSFVWHERDETGESFLFISRRLTTHPGTRRRP